MLMVGRRTDGTWTIMTCKGGNVPLHAARRQETLMVLVASCRLLWSGDAHTLLAVHFTLDTDSRN